jgi:anaerobic magnesium-protoporphyrin IX monomethyl ester cyclase
MRVLLIYPPISIEERYSSEIGHAGGKQIPLGIYYLASYLRQHKHDVRIIDAEALDLSNEKILTVAHDFHPQVTGISSTTVAFHRALNVADFLKEKLPDIITVIGGPHPTAAVEDVMQHKAFDYAVLGEGETTFHRLLEALENNADFRMLSGLAFRDAGTIRVNPKRDFVEGINSLPFPAYDLVDDFSLYNPPPMNYKKLPVANIITSRGCPNQCTFCGHSVFGRSLRQRSPESIAGEIQLLHTHYNIREIAFVDDTFTINPQRIEALFNLLNEKNISLDAVYKTVDICHRLDIRTKGFFIVGHPGETSETIEQTIKFALDIPLDDIVVTLNTPLPGTEQFRTAQQFGCIDRTDWSKFNMWNPVFIPAGLTAGLLLKRHREFYRRFYLRPRIIKRYAASFFSKSGIRRALSLVRSLPFLFRNR